MIGYKVLILTDHTGHSPQNSVYELAKAMHRSQKTISVDIASRGFDENRFFFFESVKSKFFASKVNDSLIYSKNGAFLRRNMKSVELNDYNFIWLRLPPPLSLSFIEALDKNYPNKCIINSPKSIYKTGSKEFLLNFPEICPPMMICRSLKDIIALKERFPIVLKPFREYGGKGIIRIDGNKVWLSGNILTFEDFIQKISFDKIEYLGVRFLKNVGQGDKRIIVVNGEILGATLRLPSGDNWLCNASMGGTSHDAIIEDEEKRMIEVVNPILSKMGIVMYGLDTLVDDDGKRVLSEINTTSIGGLAQAAKLNGRPLIENAVELIFKYFEKNNKNVKSH